MENYLISAINFLQLRLKNLKGLSLFLWLFFLYAVLLFFVIGTLSSYQFQERARQYTGLGEVSLAFILELSVLQGDRVSTFSRLRSDREYKDQRITFLVSEQRKSKEELDVVYAQSPEFYSVLDPLLEEFGESSDIISGLFNVSDYQDLWTPRYISDLNEQGVDPSRIVLFEEALSENIDWDQQIDRLTRSSSEERWQEEINTLEVEVAEITKAMEDLTRRSNCSDTEEECQEQEDLDSIAADLRSLNNVCLLRPSIMATDAASFFARGICFDKFTQLNRSVLVLLLTLAMGTLGSTIFITMEYIAVQEITRPVSWYVIRPLLGMVTAIAIFVLAKAGQLTISADSGSAELNPFVISFLAIISGMLTEQAIEKIGKSAGVVFKSGDSAGNGDLDNGGNGDSDNDSKS